MKKSFVALALLAAAAALCFPAAAHDPPGAAAHSLATTAAATPARAAAQDLKSVEARRLAKQAPATEAIDYKLTKADVCRLHARYPDAALLTRACHFGPNAYPVSLRAPRDWPAATDHLHPRALGGGSGGALYRT